MAWAAPFSFPSEIRMEGYKQLTVDDFVAMTQESALVEVLDKHIADWSATCNLGDRELLRACFFALRMVAQAMPKDDKRGLDATHINTKLRLIFPPLRECIGAIIGLDFEFAAQPRTSNADNPPNEVQQDVRQRGRE